MSHNEICRPKSRLGFFLQTITYLDYCSSRAVLSVLYKENGYKPTDDRLISYSYLQIRHIQKPPQDKSPDLNNKQKSYFVVDNSQLSGNVWWP